MSPLRYRNGSVKHKIIIQTRTIFIIFWDFLIFYQIFLSVKVIQCAIIIYKHGIYQLPHELSNDLTLIRLGFLRVFFLGEGSILFLLHLPHPFIFQKELIWYQYNSTQFLNNLKHLKVKNADIICYKLTSFVSL